MQIPTTYRLKISDIESIYGMSAYPLDIEGYDTYLICHSQLPNSKRLWLNLLMKVVRVMMSMIITKM